MPEIVALQPDLQPYGLQAMQQLYTHDAVQAYTQIVEEPHAQDRLREYFETKAAHLPEVISDENQRFWQARCGGSIVGMAGYNIERRLIHSVYVSDEMRGQGIGSCLLRHVVQETTEESPRLPRTILVATANTKAIALYERLGFRPTEMIKKWNVGGASIPELEMSITG